MTNLPNWLTFEQAAAHISAIEGLDEFDIFDLLNEHARAGDLKLTGKDARFPRNAGEPYVFARQKIPERFFEWYEIKRDNLGECSVQRKSESLSNYGWTSIRFCRDGIFKLLPNRSDSESPSKHPSLQPFSPKMAEEIFTEILEHEPNILQDEGCSKCRDIMMIAEGRHGGGNNDLRPIFKKVSNRIIGFVDRRGRPSKPKINSA